MADSDPTRRRFLARAAGLVAALPLLAASRRARSAPLPKLPVTNPQAKALSYTEEANASAHTSHKPGSFCLNCQFYTAGSHGCALFAGFAVAPKGWCAAWAKKG